MKNETSTQEAPLPALQPSGRSAGRSFVPRPGFWGWLGLALLALGALARFGRLDLMLFDFDEGIASIYALQFLVKGDFPLRGVKTSLEFYNTPLFIYLVSIPYVFSSSPVVATGFLQALFLGAAGWLYAQMRRTGWAWGAAAALAVACLTPGHLLLCLRLWGHALIPTFSTVAFLCVWSLAERPRCRWTSFVLPLAMSAAQQVHFSGALLLFDVLLALWILRIRPHWRWALAGAACAMLSYLPYVFHLAQTGFQDVKTITSLIGHGSGTGGIRAPLFWAALHSFSDFGTGTAFQTNYPRFLLRVPGFSLWKIIAAAFLLMAALAATRPALQAFWRARTSRQDAPPQEPERSVAAALACLWTLVPLVAFGLLKVETVPAYWLIALPGPWVLLGAAVEGIGNRKTRAAVGVLFCLLLTAASLDYLWHYFGAVAAADPKLLVYPSYRDEKDATHFVSDTSSNQHVWISQDARKLQTGIDLQLLYILSVHEGNALRFSCTDGVKPQAHYLLHTRSRSLPASLWQDLQHWPKRRFGLIDVYLNKKP